MYGGGSVSIREETVHVLANRVLEMGQRSTADGRTEVVSRERVEGRVDRVRPLQMPVLAQRV